VTRSELVAAVQAMQADASAPVIILAERDVRYDNVVQALNLLQSQGIARVGLAVRQE